MNINLFVSDWNFVVGIGKLSTIMISIGWYSSENAGVNCMLILSWSVDHFSLMGGGSGTFLTPS